MKRKIKILDIDDLPAIPTELTKRPKYFDPYKHIVDKKSVLLPVEQYIMQPPKVWRSAWHYRTRNVRRIDRDNMYVDYASSKEGSGFDCS